MEYSILKKKGYLYLTEFFAGMSVMAVELGARIDYGRNPKSYLASIALRIWKNRRRKYAWRSRIAGTRPLMEEEKGAGTAGWGTTGAELEMMGLDASAEEAFLKQELKDQVNRAVEKLDEKYRIPIYLHYMLGLPVAQIGKALKLPQGTVKSRLHKSRELLRKELEVMGHEA